MKKVVWSPKGTSRELSVALSALSEYYPLEKSSAASDGQDDIAVRFEQVPENGLCEISLANRVADVRYDKPAQALRAVGALLSGDVRPGKTSFVQRANFDTLGIMLDCSRNAVMTVDHLKLWLRRLALMGYNMVMLYTEDTYQLPGEPWFGYQRGPYSARELKEIDAYAARLHIEVIPCIQTLGHLEKILRHPAYNKVKDTERVMLVGEPATYELIDKMIAQWKKVCRTGRIHIGMDETHDLGRGRYLDLHGYRNGFDLFNEHLGKVVEICEKHGLAPMIWSDMYFRLGSKTGNYYDPSSVIPPEVAAGIPDKAQLVYWDYYHEDKAFYLDWIERHRRMGREPIMGSGIWTWNKYWHDNRTTLNTAVPCMDACVESGVKEIFFTMWGDNGAYCDHDSAFQGMLFCADYAYAGADRSERALEKRFAAICGGSYKAHCLAAQIHDAPDGFNPDMWDDPIFETKFRAQAKDFIVKMRETARYYVKLAARLKRYANEHSTGSFSYAWTTARALADRYTLTCELLDAYRKKDRKALHAAKRRIAGTVESIAAMEEAFRQMWMAHNKPEGIETIQARFGMLQARYRELERRLWEYLRGDIDRIAEFHYRCPPAK